MSHGGSYVQLKTATDYSRVFLLVAGVGFLVLLSACQSPGGGPDPIAAATPSVKQNSTPTPEPSPIAVPTDTPEPTPTPGPIRKETAVENLVLLTIMTCAGQLADATGSKIAPDFEPLFENFWPSGLLQHPRPTAEAWYSPFAWSEARQQAPP